MWFLVTILVLFVLAHVLVAPSRALPYGPSGPPPGWEPAEEREARLRLDALIASYPVRHREFIESRRPTAWAIDHATNHVFLEWPDGREEWMSLVELRAKDLHPKGLAL